MFENRYLDGEFVHFVCQTVEHLLLTFGFVRACLVRCEAPIVLHIATSVRGRANLQPPRTQQPMLAAFEFAWFSCFSTKLSSFSSEEKRCRISCMRKAMLRIVSICERELEERPPGSSSSNSEFPSTDVSALFRLWPISSAERPSVA